MNEACINKAIEDTTVWIYILKQHASDEPENCNKITVEPLMSHGLFTNVLIHFWVWEHFCCIALYGGPESLTGLEQHEG